jgi:glycosyltransferase involved in cell wall biosynthesis
VYGPTVGTHVHVLEVVAGLARTGKVRLTVIVPDQPSQYAIGRLESERDVSLVTHGEASSAGGPRADVVHRPYQLSNVGDLTFLRTLGDRLILTQQDLIGYHNPSYFQTPEAWRDYRRLTALALAAADRVAFFSSHARDDAVAEDLVDSARASVVRLGVDHSVAPVDRRSSAPAGAERLAPSVDAMLCLGTDFHHKNRLFALRILEYLRGRHGWNGVLVLAGPTVRHGSSHEQEAEWLAAHPELAAAVLDLGAVTEAEKAWLFERSALVLYPSVVEGFGLIPFEAAAHGTPCMWAPVSSLGELLPKSAAEIVPWDADKSAQRALALMREEGVRQRNLEAIRAAAEPLTWDATAEKLVELYEAMADAPTAATAFGSAGWLTDSPLSEDALRLVGPGGELPPDVHRPLLALATHPRISAPLFGALKLGYRASYRLRRELHKRT